MSAQQHSRDRREVQPWLPHRGAVSRRMARGPRWERRSLAIRNAERVRWLIGQPDATALRGRGRAGERARRARSGRTAVCPRRRTDRPRIGRPAGSRGVSRAAKPRPAGCAHRVLPWLSTRVEIIVMPRSLCPSAAPTTGVLRSRSRSIPGGCSHSERKHRSKGIAPPPESPPWKRRAETVRGRNGNRSGAPSEGSWTERMTVA